MRTQRAFRTFIASIAYSFAGLLTGFFATPLLLKGLGEERFGVFRVLNDWLSHLGIFETAFAGSLMALFVQALGNKDPEQVKKVFNTGIYYFTQIAGTSIVAGLVFVAFCPTLIPSFDPWIAEELRWGAIILIADYLFYPLVSVRYYLDSKQEGYKIHLAQTFQLITVTGLMVIFAQKGYGIIGQSFGYVLGRLPYQILLYVFSRKDNLRFQSYAFFRSEPSLKNTVQRLNMVNFLFHTTGRLSLMTNNMVIGYFLGSAQVVPFFITLKLSQVLQGFLLNFGNSSWAAMGEIYTKGDQNHFNEKIIEMTRLILIASFAVFAPVFLFNESFVHLWVGFQHFGGKSVTLLGALNATFIAVFAFWGWCFTATGKIENVVSIHVAWAIISVGCGVVLTKFVGISGPILGNLVAYGLTLMWGLPLAMRVNFGLSLKRLTGAIAFPMIVGFVFVYFAHRLWGDELISNWLELVVKMAATGTAFILISCFIVLRKQERILWFNRIASILDR